MNTSDRGDNKQRGDADNERAGKQCHPHHSREHEHRCTENCGWWTTSRLKKFVRDETTGEASGDAEQTEQKAPSLNDDFGAGLGLNPHEIPLTVYNIILGVIT